jgi:hypothetical protein
MRLRKMQLNKADLPTFGRPTMAITGNSLLMTFQCLFMDGRDKDGQVVTKKSKWTNGSSRYLWTAGRAIAGAAACLMAGCNRERAY